MGCAGVSAVAPRQGRCRHSAQTVQIDGVAFFWQIAVSEEDPLSILRDQG